MIRGHSLTPNRIKVRFLCATSVFSVPLWLFLLRQSLTTETQRTQRLHREDGSGLQHLLCLRVAEAGDFGDDQLFNTFGDTTDSLFVEELLEVQVNRKHLA